MMKMQLLFLQCNPPNCFYNHHTEDLSSPKTINTCNVSKLCFTIVRSHNQSYQEGIYHIIPITACRRKPLPDSILTCHHWGTVTFTWGKLQRTKLWIITQLTHWPLGHVVIILGVKSQNPCCKLSSWEFIVKLLSGECHRTPWMIN